MWKKSTVFRKNIKNKEIYKEFIYNPITNNSESSRIRKYFDKDRSFEESFEGIDINSFFTHKDWKTLVTKGVINDIKRETILTHVKKKNIDIFLLKLEKAVTQTLIEKNIKNNDINLSIKITISITLLDNSFLTLPPKDFFNIYFIEKLIIDVPTTYREINSDRKNTSNNISNINNIIDLVSFDNTNKTIIEPFDKNTLSLNWNFAILKEKIQYFINQTEDQVKLLSDYERGLIQVLCKLISTELNSLMVSPPVMDETVKNNINSIISDCNTIIYPTSVFQRDSRTEYIFSSDIDNIINFTDDTGESFEIAEVTSAFIKNISVGSTTINSTDTYFNNVTISQSVSTDKIDVNNSAYIKGNTTVGGNEEIQGNINVCGIGKNTLSGDTTCTDQFRCDKSISCSEFQNSSDRRLKENISHIQNASNNIKLLNPVQYSFINDEKKRIKMGIIAQEIKEIFPDIVNDNGDHLTVEYNSLIGLLIKGFQEQQEEISELRRKIEFIEEKNE